jgi:hypothetical protein
MIASAVQRTHDAAARLLDQSGHVGDDPDVIDIWWPDLLDWLGKDFAGID